LSILILFVYGPVSAETLDRARVIELARLQSPMVRLAVARAGETLALRVGARTPTAPNPEIGISVGPRALPTGTIVDVVGSLVIPLDLSGASGMRAREADQRARVAEAETDNARRLAIADALDGWVAVLGSRERVGLEIERVRLDEALWTSARARREAGTIGEFDLQLASVLRADGRARLQRAEGAHEAAIISLCARLGLSLTEPVRVVGTLGADPAPTLDALLTSLARRPDRVAAELNVGVADTDAVLQRRLGTPAPRLTATGGRDSELFVRLGVDLPLPVYQRNQTALAVANAHQTTAAIARVIGVMSTEAELRGAHATYVAARRAFATLDAATSSMTDAEHLAQRSYELGQTTLANLVVARRETSNARAAHLDAKILLAHLRVALDAAAGADQ